MSDFLNPFEWIDRHGSKLPHWQQEDVMLFVTFRLGDAMPQEKLNQWREERNEWLLRNPEPWSEEEENAYHRLFTWRMESWLDQGEGSCLLRDPVVRFRIERVLRTDDPVRAIHHAWVLMPNHVHLLFKPLHPIDALLKTWKGVSARRIGRGPIWQSGYRDTLIRDDTHLRTPFGISGETRSPSRHPPSRFGKANGRSPFLDPSPPSHRTPLSTQRRTRVSALLNARAKHIAHPRDSA